MSSRLKMGIRMVTRVALLTVVLHAIIAIAHGVAHYDLGVELSGFQTAYVVVVVGAAPVVAAGLLWAGWSRLGLILLAVSMAAALVFGIYWHYVADSPDHVSQLPEGKTQDLFRVTALLLVLSETFGVAVGLWGLTKGAS